jgi:hypothetical protein
MFEIALLMPLRGYAMASLGTIGIVPAALRWQSRGW